MLVLGTVALISSIYSRKNERVPKRGKGYWRRLNRQQSMKHGKIAFAAHMRENMTKAEKVLWHSLKPRGFMAQYVLHGYIVDFYHPTALLCIEADGPIHDKQQDYDRQRDAILKAHGYQVLRFGNTDIRKHTGTVLQQIVTAAQKRGAITCSGQKPISVTCSTAFDTLQPANLAVSAARKQAERLGS